MGYLCQRTCSNAENGKPVSFTYFLFLGLGNENAKRSQRIDHTVTPCPKPAQPAPAPGLAAGHSAAPGHLLLPSRPEPPLEFVLIPQSRARPRSLTRRAC